jgi:hypothetical protein
MIRFALVAVVALTLSTAAQAGKCSSSSASGLGVTKDIAMFMSNKALGNMLAKNGEKGVGKITTTCETTVGTTCISKQKSCK